MLNVPKDTTRSKKDLLSSLKYAAEKKFGKNSLIIGEEASASPIICSTGSYLLDYALGCLGIPKGRVLELYGPESGGKSSLALIMAASVQKNTGLSVGYIDAEFSFDKEWAKKLGVNTEDLLIFQPQFGDEAFTMAELMLSSQAVGLVIIDSVSALRPRAVVEGEYGDFYVGQQARLMSLGLNKITPIVADSKGSLVFVNQIRQKIGTWGANPETTSGGESLKFYSSVRLRISRKEVIGKKDFPEGFITKVKVTKNKCGVPFREAELSLYLNRKVEIKETNSNGENIFKIIEIAGINPFEEILDLASKNNIVKKKDKQTYYYNDVLLGQGKEEVISYFKNNTEIFEEIKEKVFNEVLVVANSGEEGSFIQEIKKKENEPIIE